MITSVEIRSKIYLSILDCVSYLIQHKHHNLKTYPSHYCLQTGNSTVEITRHQLRPCDVIVKCTDFESPVIVSKEEKIVH